jgi:hypothetical protein
MRKFSKKQFLAAGAAAAILAAGGGVAYAYWSTTGSGTGNATTSGGVAQGIAITGDVADAMFPGDSAQTVTFTATNTSTQSVYVSGVKAYLSVAKAAGAPAGTCDSTDYLLNGSEAPGTAETAATLAWSAQEIAAGADAKSTFTIQFNDKTSNQDACKGASVTVNYASN